MSDIENDDGISVGDLDAEPDGVVSASTQAPAQVIENTTPPPPAGDRPLTEEEEQKAIATLIEQQEATEAEPDPTELAECEAQAEDVKTQKFAADSENLETIEDDVQDVSKAIAFDPTIDGDEEQENRDREKEIANRKRKRQMLKKKVLSDEDNDDDDNKDVNSDDDKDYDVNAPSSGGEDNSSSD